MENLSHSLSKRSYSGNGIAAKTVYDDVFGGPPKFGVPSLSPRVEDYSEIFESFHASRATSIPILDLPLVEEADLSFDVRGSKFDYSEVFGGFSGLDFAPSYEELFDQSNGGVDSSDEAWTPAQSKFLSHESDPYASSEKNQSLSKGDSHRSLDGTKQFNISHHKANPKGKEDMSNGMTHVTQFHSVPGFTFVVNETPRLRKKEDENSHLQVTNDLNLSINIGGGFTEGKRFRKTMSQPPNCDFGIHVSGSDLNPLAGHGKTGSPRSETFLSVSDISLKTQPSQLPPPTRRPPALAVKKDVFDKLNSKLRASKSYAFERMAGDSSPPYFDVEIDASSSAAASAAAMKDAVEKAQEKLRSAKELMERKKEGRQSRIKLRLENEIKYRYGKARETFDRSNSFKDERVQETCEREGSGMKPYGGEERQKLMKTTQLVSGSIGGEKHINVAGKSAERKHGNEDSSLQESHETEGTVAWREATQFYDVGENQQVKDENIFVQNTKSHVCQQEKKAVVEAFEQQKYGRKKEATREARECERNGNQLEVTKGACEWDENKGRQIATKESCGQEEDWEKANVAQKVCEWKENEKKLSVSQQHGEIEKTLSEADKCEEGENLIEDQLIENELEAKHKLNGANEKAKNEKKLKDAHERKENEKRSKKNFEREEHERELKEAVELAENEKRLKETPEQEAYEKQRKEAREREEIEKKQNEAFERGENEKILQQALKQEENEKRSKEAFEQEESENGLKVGLEQEENKKEQKLACEREQNEKKLREGLKHEENPMNFQETLEQEENAKKQNNDNEGEEDEKKLNDACVSEDNEKRIKEDWEQEENGNRLREAHEREESEKRAKVDFKEESIEKKSKEDSELEETWKMIEDAGNWEGLRGQNKDDKQTESEEYERKLNLTKEIHVSMERQNFKASDGACNMDKNETQQATRVASEHDKNSEKLEVTQEILSCEEDGKLRTEPKDCESELEAVEGLNVLVKERFNLSGMNQNESQLEKTKVRMEDASKSLHLHDSVVKSNGDSIGIGLTRIENRKRASEMASDPEHANMLTDKQEDSGQNIKGVRFAFDQEGSQDKFTSSQVVREWVEHGRKMGDALAAALKGKGNSQNTAQKVTSQSTERKEKNSNDTLTPEEREKEERLKREREMTNDRLRKIEEDREREREREKDRMAVDRATLETREMAFAEARDRVERAALERATAEGQQRAMAEALERLEKASAEAREKSLAEKASTEARLRAERAAVERATAEAQECAVEKAMAEKVAFEARKRVERSVADKFSASSSSGGMRPSSSSSDLQDMQLQSVGSSSGSRHSHASVHVGGFEGESAQRCKARLERHRRTAERAAKALAEKNMRDLLAQREQAQRNRLAEALDAEVKRWSSGKEGNLRALLSTLQYILGPVSGWQPIPLTDVVTAVAVKKAYRKATLCVHPDKLQQRGASIQQKYISEKVFDLLKEAWSQFNSDER